MNIDKLITMANQIADNFAAYPDEMATKKVASHLGEFWEKRMLTGLYNYVKTDGSQTNALVRKATKVLMEKV